jgi:hypothetical protein
MHSSRMSAIAAGIRHARPTRYSAWTLARVVSAMPGAASPSFELLSDDHPPVPASGRLPEHPGNVRFATIEILPQGFASVPHAHRPEAWIRRFRMRRVARRAAHAHVAWRETPAVQPAPIPAAALAREHARLTQAAPFDLARALTTHDEVLAHAFAVARTAATDNRRIEPAAEWLIDNVYLIRNEIREVREALSA